MHVHHPLAAEFVAITQVLVYIGAVIVLFLFGIMLTRAPMRGDGDLDNDQKISAGIVSLFLVGVMSALLIDVKQQYQQASFIPDANSTLRFTYGHVRGYSPADATTMAPLRAIEVDAGPSAGIAAATAADPGSFAVKRWNYRYSQDYGSKDWSVRTPDKEGRDEVGVKSAKLLPDGQTVLLELEDVVPVMQMEVKYNLDDAGGRSVKGQFWMSINRVPASR